MDQIKIKNLEIFGYHGVLEEENKLGQKFIVSATAYLDTREAGKSDDLTKTIHYGEMALLIKKVLEENTFALLERAAEIVCEEVLLTYPLIRKMELEIKKPWAPILLPLETVSVTIERGWHKVYVGLGSNLGDKKKYLENALEQLDSEKEIKVKKVSSFYETEPYGYKEQDTFLNACACIETLQTPRELLDTFHQIEARAKRERVIHWGPRTLDLDILLYDDKIIDSEDLIIPHKELHKRMFVLEPLCEIASHVRHPLFLLSMEQLKEQLDKN
ncbi:MAG: 2-amino-4-hydroxy-6-hydroxymethyldihydropteridine diphosphokinase [Lachnospiraceae bacterium]